MTRTLRLFVLVVVAVSVVLATCRVSALSLPPGRTARALEPLLQVKPKPKSTATTTTTTAPATPVSTVAQPVMKKHGQHDAAACFMCIAIAEELRAAQDSTPSCLGLDDSPDGYLTNDAARAQLYGATDRSFIHDLCTKIATTVKEAQTKFVQSEAQRTTVAAQQLNFFRHPSRSICTTLNLCTDDSLPQVPPADRDVQEAIHRQNWDLLNLRARQRSVRVTVPPKDSPIAKDMKAFNEASLSINFNCANAKYFKADHAIYQSGWDLETNQADRQVACPKDYWSTEDKIMMLQSRYQKESFWLHYPLEPSDGTEFTRVMTSDEAKNHKKWLQENPRNTPTNHRHSALRPLYAGVNFFHLPSGFNPNAHDVYGSCALHLLPRYKNFATTYRGDSAVAGCVSRTTQRVKDDEYVTTWDPLAQSAAFTKMHTQSQSLEAMWGVVSSRFVPGQTLPNGSNDPFPAQARSCAKPITLPKVHAGIQVEGAMGMTAVHSTFPRWEAIVHARLPISNTAIAAFAGDFLAAFGTDAGTDLLAAAEKHAIPLAWVWNAPTPDKGAVFANERVPASLTEEPTKQVVCPPVATGAAASVCTSTIAGLWSDAVRVRKDLEAKITPLRARLVAYEREDEAAKNEKRTRPTVASKKDILTPLGQYEGEFRDAMRIVFTRLQKVWGTKLQAPLRRVQDARLQVADLNC